MTDDLKALLEARDRHLTRSVDYDLKVLTLMFGIAVAWGALRDLETLDLELMEIVLAVSGLMLSLAWCGRRRFFWRIDAAFVQAIDKLASPVPGHDGVSDRLAPLFSIEPDSPAYPDPRSIWERISNHFNWLAARVLRYGDGAAVLIFVFLTMVAVMSLFQTQRLQ